MSVSYWLEKVTPILPKCSPTKTCMLLDRKSATLLTAGTWGPASSTLFNIRLSRTMMQRRGIHVLLSSSAHIAAIYPSIINRSQLGKYLCATATCAKTNALMHVATTHGNIPALCVAQCHCECTVQYNVQQFTTTNTPHVVMCCILQQNGHVYFFIHCGAP